MTRSGGKLRSLNFDTTTCLLHVQLIAFRLEHGFKIPQPPPVIAFSEDRNFSTKAPVLRKKIILITGEAARVQQELARGKIVVV